MLLKVFYAAAKGTAASLSISCCRLLALSHMLVSCALSRCPGTEHLFASAVMQEVNRELHETEESLHMDLSLLDRHATGSHDRLHQQGGSHARPPLRQSRSSSAGVHAAAVRLESGTGAGWSTMN